MRMLKAKPLGQGLILALCLIWLEHLFYVMNQKTTQGFPLFWVVLLVGLVATISFGCQACLGIRFSKYVSWVWMTLMSFYAFTQLAYLRQMEHNYNLALLYEMFHRVNDHAGDFTSHLNLIDGLIWMPWLVLTCLWYAIEFQASQTHLRRGLFIISLSSLISMGSIHVQREQSFLSSTQMGFKVLGLNAYFVLDLVNPYPEEAAVVVDASWPSVDELIAHAQSLPQTEIDLGHTHYLNQVAGETRPAYQAIDQYLLQRPQRVLNAYTGMLEGKNLILVMVEAFDYVAIDPTLTPTLSMMMNEGWHFARHYTPQYSCATGESEWIALTSLIPSSRVCTPNSFAQNTHPYSLFNLFNAQGYKVSSYHNYSDKFYERTEIHHNLGSTFYNNTQLKIPVLKGWPSDVDLFQQAYPIMSEQSPFMSLVITSSTHFPYDVDSTLGNRYLEQIQAVHPDMPLKVQRYLSKAMELDRGLAWLMDRLRQDDRLEDTLIVLFGDHFPFRMEREHLLEYGNPENIRQNGLNLYLSPLIFYGAGLEPQQIETISSTYAILPTLANLYGLAYDGRWYMGQDLMEPTIDHIAFFENFSFIHEEGTYQRLKDSFTPSDGMTQEDILAHIERLEAMHRASMQILELDYFHDR